MLGGRFEGLRCSLARFASRPASRPLFALCARPSTTHNGIPHAPTTLRPPTPRPTASKSNSPSCSRLQMPPLTFHPSRRAILLVAVVEREHSFLFKHATSPNHPPQHPAVVAAHASLTQAPDFIFPPHLPPPHIPPRPCDPSHPSYLPDSAPPHLSPSSSAVYLALSEPVSDSDPPSFTLRRPSQSSFPCTSRTFSNLSYSNNFLPRRPAVLRRPTSSPPPPLSTLAAPPCAPPPIHHSTLSSSSTDPTVSVDESCRSSVESRRRRFRATLLSATTHVFAITAQDGSRQYAFCRPLSPSHALVVVTSLPHTALYVSALERTAATYAFLVDDAVSNQSNLHGVCSSFVADNIMRCPPDVAKRLTEALLTSVGNCSVSPFKDRVSCHVTPSCSTPYIPSSTDLKDQEDACDQATDVENISGPCLTLSTASSALSGSDARTPRDAPDPVTVSDNWQQEEGFSFWNTEANSWAGATNPTSNRNTTLFPWEVVQDAPNASSFPMERVIELADATLLLRHFSVRSLVSIVVALLEERRVCFVGPNTAVVSRAVLALDNLVRPFKWPHLISPILLAHILPVLGAPFPYLVGILDGHFPATKELPLENVMFADISSGKVTTVECPGELYRHIPRRIRSRLERRLARAKVSCARQILRSRSMLFSPAVSTTATSIIDFDDQEDFAKKEKPSLLKRSRSFVGDSEVSPQNIWLDHETTATIDKAMRKFFAELLEGLVDVRDVDTNNKLDLDSKSDGFNHFFSQTSASTAVSLGSYKRDSEKRQLAKSFQRTQMFMQWRDEMEYDLSFGLGTSEAEPQRGSVSRKRSKDRDLTPQPKKATTVADEELMMKSPKVKIRLTSDMEDMFSGDDAPTAETEVVRKRFRSKRKLGRRQGGRLQFSSDVVKSEDPFHGAAPNADDNSSKPLNLLSATEMSVSADHMASPECEADLENEVPSRRPWLPLRLPSSPWTAARDGTTLSGREGDTESEACDQSDEGEETDPFDEPEESADITDMFPMENVVTSWTRMRQWSRRRNRQSARV